MKQFTKEQIVWYWISVLLLWIGAYFIARYDIFSVQNTSQSSAKTSLESKRWLNEWDVKDIQWNIYIWPYRDLRKQRYEFLWYPKTLQFRLYNFTFEDTKRFFHELAFNGTKIQWIVESSQYASKDNQFQQLLDWFRDNKNIVLVPDERLWVQYQHAKTFIGDDRFIMQTANMTYSSFNKNREVFFFWTDTWVTASLHQLFYNDWMSQPTNMNSLHPNLVVCPFNCRQRIEALLQHARSSIIMYQQYIGAENIQKILSAKRDEWVDIKLILGKFGDAVENQNTPDQKFYASMSGSVKFQSSPYIHAKAILVDNQFLLVGSMNISDTSLDKNREIWILLINRFQIEKLMNMFMKDWAK